MNFALWIVAGLLAVVFLAAGAAKLVIPKEKMVTVGGAAAGWTQDVSDRFVKTIGALEVLAAVGLILPGALDIAPVLVPLAALGLVAVMTGAMITHGRRKEMLPVAANLTYLALAAFLAWGRFGPEPFTG